MNTFSNSFASDKWSPFENIPSIYNVLSPQEVANRLEGRRQNGLVDIAILQDPTATFRMQERVSLRNRPTNYYDALIGTTECNVLADVFFSAKNMEIIQNDLRYGVYKMSGGKINVPNQSVDNLKVIMRSIYMQYAEHYPNDIKGQVSTLNQHVLNYAIPNVYSEAVGYLKYLQDQSMLPVPNDRPVMPDKTFKQLSPQPFVDIIVQPKK